MATKTIPAMTALSGDLTDLDLFHVIDNDAVGDPKDRKVTSASLFSYFARAAYVAAEPPDDDDDETAGYRPNMLGIDTSESPPTLYYCLDATEDAAVWVRLTQAGDMLKAVYDSDNDGVVDVAETAPWSGITDKPSTFAPSAHSHAWADITGKPSTFTPSSHSHVISDVTGLQTALDGKAASTHTHAATDITSGTVAVSRGGTGAGTLTSGNYLVGNGTAAIETKTPSQVLSDIGAAAASHSHAISDVTGLQSALDGKASSSHTHALGDLSNVSTSGAANGYSLVYESSTSTWKPTLVSGGGGGSSSWGGIAGTLADQTDLQAALDARAVLAATNDFAAAQNVTIQDATDWSSGLNVRKRGNTGGATNAVASGAEVGYHTFLSWDGGAYGRNAYAIVRATQAQSSGKHGASYSIAVTENDAADPTVRFFVDHDGKVGIGTTSPGEMLSVAGNLLVSGTYARAATPGSGDPTDLVNRGFLATALSGKADTSHNHAAGDVTSGTFDVARIPSLSATKITTDTLAVARGGTGIASYTTNNYLRASGTTTLEQRTPSQVLSDIGAYPIPAVSGYQVLAVDSGTPTTYYMSTGADGYTIAWRQENGEVAVGTPSASSHATTKAYVDTNLGGKADDSAVVKLTGNQTIAGTKTFSSTISGSVSGNAGTATTLATSRTIAISGAVTGTATSFNGSQNITIPITALDVGVATAGTLAVARGGTGIASYTANNYLRASGTTSLEQRTPSQVLSDIGAAASSHSHALGDLSNVTLSSPASGEGLVYNGSAWVNGAVGGSNTLAGQSGGTDGRVVRWSSASTWANASQADTADQLTAVAFKQSGNYYPTGSLITGLSGLTAGSVYYLTTSGQFSTTAPTPSSSVRLLVIGKAVSTTTLLFAPGIPIGGE